MLLITVESEALLNIISLAIEIMSCPAFKYDSEETGLDEKRFSQGKL